MSVATEISRIQTDRNTIRNALIEWGQAQSTDNLDVLAATIASLQNRGAVDAEVQEGQTYTIPQGYHNGSGTVRGVAGGGNYQLQAKSVTPTKNEQSVTPDEGKYGLSSVTVAAIPEAYQDVTSVTATAADVLANKVIIDSTGQTVAGTIPVNGAIAATFDPLSQTSVAIAAGYREFYPHQYMWENCTGNNMFFIVGYEGELQKDEAYTTPFLSDLILDFGSDVYNYNPFSQTGKQSYQAFAANCRIIEVEKPT